MNPHQWRPPVHVPQNQSNRFFHAPALFGSSTPELSHKPVDAKMRPARGKVSFSNAPYAWGLRHNPIIAARLAPKVWYLARNAGRI